jgi:hypothetical protein
VARVGSADWIGERAIVGPFVMESEAIPAAVRCGSCGRHHYPDRLEVRHVHTRLEPFAEGDLSLEVRCPRCHVRGMLHRSGPCMDARNGMWIELLRQATCLWCDLLRDTHSTVEQAGT